MTLIKRKSSVSIKIHFGEWNFHKFLANYKAKIRLETFLWRLGTNYKLKKDDKLFTVYKKWLVLIFYIKLIINKARLANNNKFQTSDINPHKECHQNEQTNQ